MDECKVVTMEQVRREREVAGEWYDLHSECRVLRQRSGEEWWLEHSDG